MVIILNNLLAIGQRLKSERERLGLKQTDVVERAGISVAALSTYENGKRALDFDRALALVDMGFDMGYVLTGQRSASEPLTEDEQGWLDLYRQLADDDRQRLLKMARSLQN